MSRPGAWALAGRLVASPSEAFKAFERKDGALRESLFIYAAFLFGYAAFYSLKPLDFPSMMRNSGLEQEGFFFWLRAGMLGTFLYGAWFLALGAYLNIARGGRLLPRLLLQLLWSTGFAVLLILQLKRAVPLSAALIGWIALSAPGVWLARRHPLPWRSLLAMLLAVNLFALISFAPLALAAAIRSENLYMGVQFLFLFWMMGVTTSGLRRLTGISLPRCFLSLVLSFTVSIFLLFALHHAGLVPPDMLKASMAV